MFMLTVSVGVVECAHEPTFRSVWHMDKSAKFEEAMCSETDSPGGSGTFHCGSLDANRGSVVFNQGLESTAGPVAHPALHEVPFE